MSPAALLAEVVAGLSQRPGRSALTALGTLLGVGAFVAVIGITGSANAQIGAAFNEHAATQVSVSYVASADTGAGFPEDSEARVDAVRGVRASGLRVEWLSGANVTRYAARSRLPSVQVGIVGVSAGFWRAVQPTIVAGRPFDDFLASRRVAVVGSSIAGNLGLKAHQLPGYVYIDDAQFLVVGIVGSSERDPTSGGGVYVPVGAALRTFGRPSGSSPPTMLVTVEVGAAKVVARQAPYALDPYAPEQYRVDAVADPTVVRDKVSQDLQRLFLLLAGVSLLIGALGIANTTLVSVLDRFAEIGLRRALGALPRHVMAQFLIEATVLGGIGGLIGSTMGIAATLAVAAANDWTAVLPGWLVGVAPAVGALTGLVAGIYPSFRAARVEPIRALRH